MQRDDSASPVGFYVDRWKLSEPVLVAETATSWVFKVSRRGSAAALKLIKPEALEDERRGGPMLVWYGGEGAARVYEIEDAAVLIEWLNGHALSELVYQGKDATATDIICQIATQLRAGRAEPPPNLMPLPERFKPLFNTDRGAWPFAARDLVVRAQIVARQLLETMDEQVPLHGDLHHDNILFSPRSWVAIDPKGLLGDPAYEVASCFINPWSATDTCADPERIERLLDAFEHRLGLDRVRMLGFAVAHAALTISWCLQSGAAVNHQLAILPRLISAHELTARDLAR